MVLQLKVAVLPAATELGLTPIVTFGCITPPLDDPPDELLPEKLPPDEELLELEEELPPEEPLELEEELLLPELPLGRLIDPPLDEEEELLLLDDEDELLLDDEAPFGVDEPGPPPLQPLSTSMPASSIEGKIGLLAIALVRIMLESLGTAKLMHRTDGKARPEPDPNSRFIRKHLNP